MMVSLFVVTLLIVSIATFLIPEWTFMSCEYMLEFDSSDEHLEMTEQKHLEFHKHYFEKCVGEDAS